MMSVIDDCSDVVRTVGGVGRGGSLGHFPASGERGGEEGSSSFLCRLITPAAVDADAGRPT